MFCRQCHYDLRGLEQLRCPECGTEFDSWNPDSVLHELPRRRSFAHYFNWLVPLLIFGGIAAFFLWIILAMMGAVDIDGKHFMRLCWFMQLITITGAHA